MESVGVPGRVEGNGVTIFGAELEEVAPKDPRVCCVVGDYIVAANYNSGLSGLMPNGAFSVMNAATEQAKAYTGLSASTGPPPAYYEQMAYGYGGYAWFASPNGSTLYKVDPTNGGVTTIAIGGAFGNNATANVCAANGYIVVQANGSSETRVYRISDGSVNNMSTGAKSTVGLQVEVGNYIYCFASLSGLKLWKFDPSGGLGWWAASGGAIPGLFASNKGVYHGGYVWGQTIVGLARWDPTTFAVTTFNHTLIPGGNYLSSSDIVVGSDGWIYGVGHTSGNDYCLIGFDPTTGTFGKEALAPVRGHRYTIAAAAGKLWIPSGEPLN